MKKNLDASRYAITLEGEHLPIIIRKHRSSRRIVIRYQPLKHHISVTLPRYASIRQALRFVEEKRGWIAAQIKERAEKQRLSSGSAIPVLGKRYRLHHAPGRGVVRIEGEQIVIPGAEEFLERRLRDWLIAQVRHEITVLVQVKSTLIGRKPGKISLRDTTSHWGSCNHKGNLSFSWRLVFAPYEVLDYVVSHEVAHLAELNHSDAFWSIVAQLCPDFEAHRTWIKTYGDTLYCY